MSRWTEFRIIPFLLLFIWFTETLRVLKTVFFGICCQVWCLHAPASVSKGDDAMGAGREHLRDALGEGSSEPGVRTRMLGA